MTNRFQRTPPPPLPRESLIPVRVAEGHTVRCCVERDRTGNAGALRRAGQIAWLPPETLQRRPHIGRPMEDLEGGLPEMLDASDLDHHGEVPLDVPALKAAIDQSLPYVSVPKRKGRRG